MPTQQPGPPTPPPTAHVHDDGQGELSIALHGQQKGPEEALGDDGTKGRRTTTRTMKEKETMSVGRGRITPPPPPLLPGGTGAHIAGQANSNTTLPHTTIDTDEPLPIPAPGDELDVCTGNLGGASHFPW